MQVCFTWEAFAQVEIFVDFMPVVSVCGAFPEDVQGRAGYDLDICYDETGMMCW